MEESRDLEVTNISVAIPSGGRAVEIPFWLSSSWVTLKDEEVIQLDVMPEGIKKEWPLSFTAYSVVLGS